jgi:hypothetical protein
LLPKDLATGFSSPVNIDSLQKPVPASTTPSTGILYPFTTLIKSPTHISSTSVSTASAPKSTV